ICLLLASLNRSRLPRAGAEIGTPTPPQPPLARRAEGGTDVTCSYRPLPQASAESGTLIPPSPLARRAEGGADVTCSYRPLPQAWAESGTLIPPSSLARRAEGGADALVPVAERLP